MGMRCSAVDGQSGSSYNDVRGLNGRLVCQDNQYAVYLVVQVGGS